MSTNAAFPPYEMVKDDGTFEGIDVEVAGAIAEKLGLELVVDMGFDAASAAQTPERYRPCRRLRYSDRQEVMDSRDSYAPAFRCHCQGGSDVTMDNLGEKMIGCQKATTVTSTPPIPQNGGYGEDQSSL
jgi:polar amino acid transport system substrate-binding protein